MEFVERDNSDSSMKDIDELEELDYDLLFQVLDGLTDVDPPIDGPKYLPLTLESATHCSNLSLVYKAMIKFYRGLDFEKFEEENEEKPKVCLSCISFTCEHSIKPLQFGKLDELLEAVSKKCTHTKDDDWLLEDICINCLLDECQIKKSENYAKDDLLYLWDHQDFCDYAIWTVNLYQEYGMGN